MNKLSTILAFMVAWIVCGWLIDGLFLYFTDYSLAELVALFLEKIFG